MLKDYGAPILQGHLGCYLIQYITASELHRHQIKQEELKFEVVVLGWPYMNCTTVLWKRHTTNHLGALEGLQTESWQCIRTQTVGNWRSWEGIAEKEKIKSKVCRGRFLSKSAYTKQVIVLLREGRHQQTSHWCPLTTSFPVQWSTLMDLPIHSIHKTLTWSRQCN